MPDFDIDFCQDRRDEVIRYVQERYGRDQVAQIITFGTLQARGVLRDVGRVLQMPYGQVDKLSKLVPQNPAAPVTLAARHRRRAEAAGRARRAIRWCARAFDIAQKLEGLTRHASTHAAGIVIGDRAAERTGAALSRSEIRHAGDPVQHEMGRAGGPGQVRLPRPEDADRARSRGQAGEAARHRHRSRARCRSTTRKTYEMLARGEAVGVFQVESAGHAARADRHAARPLRGHHRAGRAVPARARWRTSRPIARASTATRSRNTSIRMLEPILKETFGVIIYQEQVMQIAQVLAGYSLGEADLLRRAMGKKIRTEMEAQRARLRRRRGRSAASSAARPTRSSNCWRTFADYGFNKSHAAAYALVAYQTAYMKANYPVEFLAASMTLDMGNTDKLVGIPRRGAAARHQGRAALDQPLRRRPSRSTATPSITRWPRCKGVGRQAVEAIVDARGERPFTDLADFAAASIRARSTSACWKAWPRPAPSTRSSQPRARLRRRVDAMLGARASAATRPRRVGQNELFGGAGRRAEPIALPAIEPWLPAERLQREYDAVGFFLSGHPLDDYAAALKRLRVQSWAEFSRAVKTGATAGRVAGTVVSRMERRTKTGNKMGIIGLSDPTGHYEAVLFSEGLAQYRDLLEPGTAVLLFLGAEVQGDEVRARIQSAEPLDAAAAKLHKGLRVFLRDDAPLEGVAKRLEPIARQPRRPDHGDGEVCDGADAASAAPRSK